MIKLVKIVTGEDIVADIELIDDELFGKSIKMKKPQRFMMTAEGIGSIPLMPLSSDESYTIGINHVVLISEPDADVKNGYSSQYGSGIVLASNNKKIIQ